VRDLDNKGAVRESTEGWVELGRSRKSPSRRVANELGGTGREEKSHVRTAK